VCPHMAEEDDNGRLGADLATKETLVTPDAEMQGFAPRRCELTLLLPDRSSMLDPMACLTPLQIPGHGILRHSVPQFVSCGMGELECSQYRPATLDHAKWNNLFQSRRRLLSGIEKKARWGKSEWLISDKTNSSSLAWLRFGSWTVKE
jgi:hypothetical protein